MIDWANLNTDPKKKTRLVSVRFTETMLEAVQKTDPDLRTSEWAEIVLLQEANRIINKRRITGCSACIYEEQMERKPTSIAHTCREKRKKTRSKPNRFREY